MSVQLRNPELIRLLAADFVTRRELSTTAGNRITLTNTDLTVSGGGALTLSAAGAYTLTVPKTGTVPVGTGTAGRIAEWVTDANTVQASTLAKTGAGVLTLSAAGTYTLTVPATGTVALLGTANVFAAAQSVDGAVSELLTLKSTTSYGRLNLNNDTSTYLDFNDYAGTLKARFNFVASGGVFVLANRTAGGYFSMQTTTAGGSVVEATRWTATQHLLVGTTTDAGKVAIDQSSTTAAIPVLYLKQSDLSEEFIRFASTVSAGNPINTTALGAYYGRVRVYVEGVGAKWIALYD